MESWGSAYYGVTLQAIHYWFCEGKAARRIEDFNPELANDDMNDFLNALIVHLFNRYAVPEVMTEIWWTWNWFDAEEMSERTGFKAEKEAMCFQRNVLFHWYFTVAEGGNLRLSPHLPVALSKQAAFWFSHAPEDLSLLQTFYWAKAKARGLEDIAAKTVAKNCSVFEKVSDLFDAVCDCVLKSKENDDEKIASFIQFIAMVKYGEGWTEMNYFGANLMPNLTLKGRTINSILRMKAAFLKVIGTQTKDISMPTTTWNELEEKESITLHFLEESYLLKLLSAEDGVENFALFNENDLCLGYLARDKREGWKNDIVFRTALYDLLAKRDFPMVKYLEDCFEGESNGVNFEIVRLAKYKDLIEEAADMEHCVAAYGSECSTGNTSVWSLRVQGEKANRLSTIQLTDYRIVQASAKLNGEPDGIVWDMLSNWKKQVLQPYAPNCGSECLLCSCAA
jgi:PcfJ-like protein